MVWYVADDGRYIPVDPAEDVQEALNDIADLMDGTRWRPTQTWRKRRSAEGARHTEAVTDRRAYARN